MLRHACITLVFTLASTAIPAVETPVAKETVKREVHYEKDFETGKGLVGQGPYKGSWESNYKEAALSIDKPLGKGNDSKYALTCHTTKALPYVSCETAIGGVVEPEGWSGGLSFSFYNGGFARAYAMYMPAVPADTTWHRAYFEPPLNQWVKMDLPLDKFFHYGHRPRRGAPLERIVFVGIGPTGDASVFQVDDIKLYRVAQPDPPKRKPQPPLPDGVFFRQDFNDPADFSVESKFHVMINHSFCWREAGGVDESGKPAERSSDPDAGCLRIQSYRKKKEVRSALLFNFPGEGTTIEFDLFHKGMTDLGVSANGTKLRRSRYRIYLRPQPEAGKWVRCRIRAEELTPYGMRIQKGREQKAGRGEVFARLGIKAHGTDAEERYILLDNFVIRRKPAATASLPEKCSPKGGE